MEQQVWRAAAPLKDNHHKDLGGHWAPTWKNMSMIPDIRNLALQSDIDQNCCGITISLYYSDIGLETVSTFKSIPILD
jgi:hypothetical protein